MIGIFVANRSMHITKKELRRLTSFRSSIERLPNAKPERFLIFSAAHPFWASLSQPWKPVVRSRWTKSTTILVPAEMRSSISSPRIALRVVTASYAPFTDS